MSRKRKAQIRQRRRRRRERLVADPLHEMHLALGEFQTEMGRLEYQMLRLLDDLNEAPIEAIFAEIT